MSKSWLEVGRPRAMARVYGLALMAAVGLWVGSATARAADPLSWSAPIQIAASSEDVLFGVSCPSTSFCAASDIEGDVLTSTDPTGGSGAWTAVHLDTNPRNAAESGVRGISCPSSSLCVAVDEAGDVLSSSTPTAGHAEAWQAAHIAAAHELSAVSCTVTPTPTPTPLCVVVGYEGDIWTSTDPTGGVSAWHEATIDAGGEPLAVACPSASLCVVVDAHGNVLHSTEPDGGSSAWSAPVAISALANGVREDLNAVSCPTTSFCAAVDGYDYIDYDGYSTGDVVTTTDPTGGAAAWSAPAHLSGAYGLFGVACPSAGFCLTSDLSGNVYSATNPQEGASAWSSSHIDDAKGLVSDLTGLSCPSPTLCVAVDAEGNVLTGTTVAGVEPPATGGGSGGNSAPAGSTPSGSSSPTGTTPVGGISSAQLVALLRGQLAPAGRAARITELLRHGGLSMSFTAPEAGTLSIQWYLVPPGAKLATHGKAKPVLVASGQRSFATARTGTITVKLTAIGKRVLRRAKRLKLVVKEMFGGSGVTSGVVVRR